MQKHLTKKGDVKDEDRSNQNQSVINKFQEITY